MDFGMSQSDMESIQSGLDPSGQTGGVDSTDNSEEYNSAIENQTQQQAYTSMRGATATNPYPESFFSRMFGAENVNYTNILGQDRINEINNLRFRQATGLPSLKTGQPYQAGDFYIGQSTDMGVVKPVPSMMDNIMNFLPGGGILNAFVPQKGLPEFDPRYQEMIKEREKSANDPTVFDSIIDFVKEKTGFGPKDSGASLAASPTGDGQMRVPDTRTFDAFGNVTGSDLDTQDMFQTKPKVQKVADVGETFKMLGDELNQYVSPTGKPVFGGSIKVDPLDKQIRYEVPVSNFLDNIFGRSA